MSESSFATQIDRAGRMWDLGRDTLDIARALDVHEAYAVWLVAQHRAARVGRRQFAPMPQRHVEPPDIRYGA